MAAKAGRKQSRNRASHDKWKFAVGQMRKEVVITDDGYTEVKACQEGCRATDDTGVSSFLVDLNAPNHSYLRDFRVDKNDKTPSFLALDDRKSKYGLRSMLAPISFGETRRPLDGPFDVNYSYRLMNGDAVNKSDFERKYFGQDVANEYASLECEQETDNLQLTVKFPSGVDVADMVSYGAEVSAWQRSLVKFSPRLRLF